MGALRVEAASGGWTLLLRWKERAERPSEMGLLSTLAVHCSEPALVTLPGPLEDGTKTLAVEGTLSQAVPPWLFEPTGLDVTLEVEESGGPLSLTHPDPVVRRAVVDPTGRGRTCAGSINLESRVGSLELRFLQGSNPLIAVELECFPSKLTYRDDFERMLAELQQDYVDQVIRLLSRTYLRRELERRLERSDAERYQIVEALLDALDRAMRVVSRQPHSALVEAREHTRIDRVRRPTAATLRALQRPAHRMTRLRSGEQVPARVPHGRRLRSFDTPPNRCVKGVLASLMGFLARVRQRGEAPKSPWGDPEL
jgi:hypothetical protein